MVRRWSGLFLLGIALLFGVSGARAEIRFGIAAEPYAPFTSKDANGQWVGWEIDLMNAICREMKEHCEIFESSWDGLIPALNAKFFDVIWTSMSITEERQKVIDFTDPYYYSQNIVVGRRNGDLDVTPDHIAAKCIGVQGGTIHAVSAQKNYPDAPLKLYSTQDEALQDLTAGRCDFVIADEIALHSFLDTETGKSCCEFKGVIVDQTDSPGVGGGVRKGDNELKAKLNSALKSVRASGEYDAISKKYFSFSIAPPE